MNVFSWCLHSPLHDEHLLRLCSGIWSFGYFALLSPSMHSCLADYVSDFRWGGMVTCMLPNRFPWLLLSEREIELFFGKHQPCARVTDGLHPLPTSRWKIGTMSPMVQFGSREAYQRLYCEEVMVLGIKPEL